MIGGDEMGNFVFSGCFGVHTSLIIGLGITSKVMECPLGGLRLWRMLRPKLVNITKIFGKHHVVWNPRQAIDLLNALEIGLLVAGSVVDHRFERS